MCLNRFKTPFIFFFSDQAGCVHFNQTNVPCDIRVLILFYSVEKKAYLGFIPNNQAAFVERLRKVISQKQGVGRQIPQSVQPQSSQENNTTGPSSGPSMNIPQQQGMSPIPTPAQMQQAQAQVCYI